MTMITVDLNDNFDDSFARNDIHRRPGTKLCDPVGLCMCVSLAE